MPDQATSPGKADILFAAGMCNGAAGTNVDQRGFARGAGGRCATSALYESAGVASAVRHQAIPATPMDIAVIPNINVLGTRRLPWRRANHNDRLWKEKTAMQAKV